MILGRKNQLFKKIKLLTSYSLRSLFIKTEKTPNPNFLKFVPGKAVMGDKGTMDFPDYKFTHISPLARKIFSVCITL